MKNELTPTRLQELWNLWQAKYPDLRFGQFVCNRELPMGYVWPELFYAETKKAYNMLWRIANGVSTPSSRKL
jgi:hypothetical protein